MFRGLLKEQLKRKRSSRNAVLSLDFPGDSRRDAVFYPWICRPRRDPREGGLRSQICLPRRDVQWGHGVGDAYERRVRIDAAGNAFFVFEECPTLAALMRSRAAGLCAVRVGHSSGRDKVLSGIDGVA